MDNYCLTKLSCNQGVGNSMTKTMQSGDGYCANPDYVIGHNEMYKQDRNRCYQARGEWNTTTSTCDFDNAEYPERYCNLYGGFWVKDKKNKSYCRLIDTEASCKDVGGIYVKQRFCQNKKQPRIQHGQAV